jgi:hypothetical protein
MPTDAAVTQAAAEAAEGVVLAAYPTSAISDLDVTVTFEDKILEVDVYCHVPEAEAEDSDLPDPEQVTAEAVAAAEDAVDELLA